MAFDYIDDRVEPLESSDVQTTLNLKRHLILLLVGLFLAALSVVWPFFEHLASERQSLNLYIGFAMSQGQPPYSDIMTRGGLLYHGLVALAYHWKILPVLVLPYGLAFYLSGLYLFKILSRLTAKDGLSWSFSLLFLGLNLVLGLGNLYPIQLAQPLVLIGFWQLLGVRSDQLKDEWLILYGVVAGLALLLDPRTLVFWLLSAGFLIVSHARRQMGARALYQQLAAALGFLLIAYSAGYVVLNTQILLPYLQQTLLNVFLPILDPSGLNYWLLALHGFALFGLGFVANIINGWSRKYEDRELTIYLSLIMLWYSVLVISAQGFGLYDLLLLLPFGLILSALNRAQKLDQFDEEEDGPRLSRRLNHQEAPMMAYLKKNLFLPVLVLILGIGLPIYQYSQNLAHFRDRQVIAEFLEKETSPSELVHVWDWSSDIYLDAKRLSSSQFPVATAETNLVSQGQLLEDEWLQHGAVYIAVNKDLPLPQALEAELDEGYKPVALDNLERFELYRLD